jgi:hypothetical protein
MSRLTEKFNQAVENERFAEEAKGLHDLASRALDRVTKSLEVLDGLNTLETI